MRLREPSLSSMVCAAVLLWTASSASAQTATPAASSKIFVEGGLAYGYQMSNSDFIEVDRGTALDGPRSGGPAVDVAAGYAFVPSLAVFGDLQYAHASTITGQDNDGDEEQSRSGSAPRCRSGRAKCTGRCPSAWCCLSKPNATSSWPTANRDTPLSATTAASAREARWDITSI